MKIKNYKLIGYGMCFLFFLTSCKKNDNGTYNSKPIFKVTPAKHEGTAGEDILVDITVQSSNPVVKLKMEENYNGSSNRVLLKDSTINPGKTFFEGALYYHVPDTAMKGDQAIVYFTVIDSKGTSATESQNFSATASKPFITAVPDKTSAGVGEVITFNIHSTCVVPTIVKIDAQAGINEGTAQTVETKNYAGVKTADWQFQYTVPAGAQSGKYINFMFIPTTSENTQNYAFVKVMTK